MQELLSRALDILRDAWRFRWYALLVSWLIAIAGWLFVCSLPNQYEVEARVHIDTKSAIQPLLHGLAVTPDYRDQVDFLIRTVLSRPHLQQIARKTGLDIDATSTRAEQALLDRLSAQIHIRSAGRRVNLYTISYMSSNADTAHAVVQQVINIMTEMALGSGTDRDSRQATQFLSQQVDRYKSRVDSLGKQIATYRKDNAELLPSGKGGYVGQLQLLQSSIQQLNDQISMAQDRRQILKKQMSGSGGDSRVVPPSQTSAVRAIDHQLTRKRDQLQQLLGRYTEKYPDVISLKRDIKRLEANRRQALASARAHPQRESVGEGGNSSLGGQISELDVQINAYKAALNRKNQQLQSLRANSGNMTQAESHLSELERNYDAANKQYQELLSRLYTARLSSEVDQSGDQLKFHVIDPPETPATPSGPKRNLLMTMVLFASLASGAAFSFFLSQIRPVFINRRALTEATGLPVLGAISMASTRQETLRRQTALALFVAGLATLMLGYLAAIALAPIGAKLIPPFFAGQLL